MDQLPRFGKREFICLLLFTFNHVVSVRRGFFFLWVLGMGYIILLWHSLSLPNKLFCVKIRNNQKHFFSSANCQLLQLWKRILHICRRIIVMLNNTNVHYAIMPMQYTAIFHGCKNDDFSL